MKKRAEMIKKMIGAVLMIAGVFIALVLFTYGGPVFPHIVGPAIFVPAGAALFLFKGKGK